MALEHFNPSIDRYDQRSVSRLFHSLWQNASVSLAVAENLAASILVAHAAAGASWEVTMYAHGLRLNVGQVETMIFSEEGARFLFQALLEMDRRYEITLTENPVYPAVPVASGVCFVPSSELPTLPATVRHAHHKYIQSATSFKRVSPFKRSFSPAVLEYVESILGTILPRPSYATAESVPQKIESLPDEIDTASPLLEGSRYQITINAYERDHRARKLCIARYGAVCIICGFSFGSVYGNEAEGIIHVHHLRPLSEIGIEYEVDPILDLRPVCPNCHAVLHRRVPAYSIEEVRLFLFQRQALLKSGAGE